MVTIGTWLEALDRELLKNACPIWPPDAYAIAGALLKRSGAYLRVFEHNGRSRYLDDIAAIGRAWRSDLDELPQLVSVSKLRAAVPVEVEQAWRVIISSSATPISEIGDSRRLAEQLIRLALIADEASAGIGIDQEQDGSGNPGTFLLLADWMLNAHDARSFCWEISHDALCVLGKQHTAARGATFRSLSLHLSLHLPNDMEARWVNVLQHSFEPDHRPDTLNLLLLPWPTQIETDDFHYVRSASRNSKASYFRFEPANGGTLRKFGSLLKHAIKKARKNSGQIDAIVLPESALTRDQYRVAERIAIAHRTILIAGVRRALAGKRRDENRCVFQPAGCLKEAGRNSRRFRDLVAELRLEQDKHHRWCLDREQLISYQLAGKLPIGKNAWENIRLPERLLYFVTVKKMTWSVLICEDLARQDPAADLIRAVGPNLVIALLMDGPQLVNRWPARYASVLVDDPGSSVLTLTSLGMAERSRPILRTTGKRAESSRVIAMWRDIQAGEIEIALDAGHDACVLTLECTTREEYAADGRGDGSATWLPVFAGMRSFRTEP